VIHRNNNAAIPQPQQTQRNHPTTPQPYRNHPTTLLHRSHTGTIRPRYYTAAIPEPSDHATTPQPYRNHPTTLPHRSHTGTIRPRCYTAATSQPHRNHSVATPQLHPSHIPSAIAIPYVPVACPQRCCTTAHATSQSLAKTHQPTLASVKSASSQHQISIKLTSSQYGQHLAATPKSRPSYEPNRCFPPATSTHLCP
jgi:hypothetical protein